MDSVPRSKYKFSLPTIVPTIDDALCELLTDLEPGDRIVVHREPCRYDGDDGQPCICIPEVWAPMGEA